MKTIIWMFVIVALSATTSSARAQTPTGIGSLVPRTPAANDGKAGVRGALAGNNPWLLSGSMSLRPIAGDSHFSESWLLTSAKIVNELSVTSRALGSVRIPIMANLADVAAHMADGSKKDSLDAELQTLVSSEDGLNVGVFPYLLLRDDGDFKATFFAGAAAKVNSYLTDSTTKTRQTLLVGRFTAGLELSVGSTAGGAKPLTISFAAVHSRFSADDYEKIFSERRSTLSSVEFTAILPLKTGMGVIFEGIGVQHKKPAFRLGLVLAAGKKEDSPVTPPPIDQCETDCTVTFTAMSLLDDTFKLTTSVTEATTEPKDCAIRASGATCKITVPSGSTLEVIAPAGFRLEGQGCSDTKCKWDGLIKPQTVKISRAA